MRDGEEREGRGTGVMARALLDVMTVGKPKISGEGGRLCVDNGEGVGVLGI